MRMALTYLCLPAGLAGTILLSTLSCDLGFGDPFEGLSFGFELSNCDPWPGSAPAETETIAQDFSTDNLVAHSDSEIIETLRYAGRLYDVAATDTLPAERHFYLPLQKSKAIFRASLVGGVIERKFLVATATSTFSWHDKANGETHFNPHQVEIDRENKLLFSIEKERIRKFDLGGNTQLAEVVAPAGHEYRQIYLQAARVFVVLVNTTSLQLHLRSYDADLSGASEQIINMNHPAVQADTGRDIDAFQSLVSYSDGYAFVSRLVPLLEGEQVYFLENYSSDFSSNVDPAVDSLRYGHILAEFNSLHYTFDDLLLLTGRERNYREHYYLVDPVTGSTTSYRKNTSNWYFLGRYSRPQICTVNTNIPDISEDGVVAVYYSNTAEYPGSDALGIRIWSGYIEAAVLVEP